MIRQGISVLAFAGEGLAGIRDVHVGHPSADLRVPF